MIAGTSLGDKESVVSKRRFDYGMMYTTESKYQPLT